MNLTLQNLIKNVVDTLRDPGRGARQVMAVEMPRQQRWETLVLIAVLSATFAYISVAMAGGYSNVSTSGMVGMAPIMLAISQLVVLLVMVFAMYLVGRAFGGRGGLDDAILLVAWLQFILICLQVLQIIATVVMPFVASLIGMAGMIVVFWLLIAFVQELHGFKSKTGIFISILMVIVAFATVLSFLFGMLGFEVTGVL